MLTDAEFQELTSFAHERWGLVLDSRRRVMVENRLATLCAHLSAANPSSLVAEVMRGEGDALTLFDALSTNHTGFFREGSHFELLSRELLSPLVSRGTGKLRIWSAGCSSGCEPYTVALLLSERFGSDERVDRRILATDLSLEQLAAARRGLYPKEAVKEVSEDRLRKHFERVAHPNGDHFRIKAHLRKRITFGLLNLLEPWPMKGPFDAIFCRNVMIYFDRNTRERLAQAFSRLLRPGGLFFIGTSESLSGYDLDLEYLETGAYRVPMPSRARA